MVSEPEARRPSATDRAFSLWQQPDMSASEVKGAFGREGEKKEQRLGCSEICTFSLTVISVYPLRVHMYVNM